MGFGPLMISTLFILSSALLGQQDYIDELFEEANRLYGDSLWAEATSSYYKIYENGYAHANLYYNLGNAYYQLGELGEAVWAYEKGLQLSPRDRGLKSNLAFVQAIVGSKAPEAFFLVEWYSSLKHNLTPAQWVNTIAIVVFLSGLFFSLSRFSTGRSRDLLSKGFVVAIVLALMSTVIFADLVVDLSHNREAIITAKETSVYSSPQEIADVTTVIHEGVKVSIKNLQDAWVEIELVNGKQGWVEANRLREL